MLFRFASVLLSCIFITQEVESRENELESWYTYWGVGIVDNTYPNEDESDNTIGAAIDALGFYWPLGNKMLIGGIINGSVDTYTATFFDSDLGVGSVEASVFNYLYAVSAMRFLSPKIGEGFFVRADLGLAAQRIEADVKTVGIEIGLEETSEVGVGFLIGGGYGFPVTSGTRLLVNLNVAVRQIEGEQTESVGLTLNGLF